MIKHTIKVPALGIEIDGSKVDSIEVGDREDYTDYRYYEINEPVSSRPTVIIKFKSGGKLDLSDVEFTDHLYSIENIVDFELGATYIVSSRYQKWAAVCLQNKTGDKYLKPIKGGTGTIISQEDSSRFNYTYEEFLPGEEVRKLL